MLLALVLLSGHLGWRQWWQTRRPCVIDCTPPCDAEVPHSPIAANPTGTQAIRAFPPRRRRPREPPGRPSEASRSRSVGLISPYHICLDAPSPWLIVRGARCRLRLILTPGCFSVVALDRGSLPGSPAADEAH